MHTSHELIDNVQQRREDVHFRILRLLENDPTLTQRQIARVLGISLGRLNYSLRALLEEGLIKAKNFKNNEKKLAYVYLLTPKGVMEKAMLTTRFLNRKIEEYEQLKAEIQSLQRDAAAGRQAGRQRRH